MSKKQQVFKGSRLGHRVRAEVGSGERRNLTFQRLWSPHHSTEPRNNKGNGYVGGWQAVGLIGLCLGV